MFEKKSGASGKSEKTKGKSSFITNFFLVLLLAVLAFEVFVTWNMTSTVNQKTQPASLSLVKITQSSCTDCQPIDSLSSPIENSNFSKIVSTKELDFSSSEAKALIQQYGIQSVPAVVVTGDFKKDNIVSL